MSDHEDELLRAIEARHPRDPLWVRVAFFGAAGAIGGLLVFNIVMGVVSGAWNW